jgi:hypothetical protein
MDPEIQAFLLAVQKPVQSILYSPKLAVCTINKDKIGWARGRYTHYLVPWELQYGILVLHRAFVDQLTFLGHV